MLALRNTLRTTTTTFIRNATTLAASELPKSAPHEGVPFSAPPEDKTVGLLGQVFLPDMEKIEFVKVEGIKIPSEPDNYTRPSRPSDDDFPRFHAPAVYTVTHPSTLPGGGPTHGSTSDDVQLGEAGDSTSSLPINAAKPASKKELRWDWGSGQGGEESHGEEGGKKWEDRPLSAEETRGLFVLGGIVLGGWLAAGAGSKTGEKLA